jgi:predicted DNA-binding protein (MmcQ/YjbR family)
MSLQWVRAHCMSLPHTTEHIQWGDDLVFKIAGKLYAVMPLIPHPVKLSFKCTPEEFADLVERPGIIPAPYLARAQWIALESPDALTRAEIARLLTKSYKLVLAKLPKKTQASFAPPGSSPVTRVKKLPRVAKKRPLS